MAIADNLFYVGNKQFSSHLLVGKKEIVLIDTPYPVHFDMLVDSIRSVGVDPAKITLILHTHHHYDHVGATRRIKELSGASVAMGARDVKRLKSLLSLEYTLDFWNVTAGYFEPFEVERPLKHGDTIDLGDTVIHCHHTPGHTPGTMSFTFDVGIDGRRHTAVLFGGPGLNFLKIKGAYYPGAKDDFAHSLDYLESLDVNVFLGAHPYQNDTLGKYERLEKGEKPNPFIDREGFLRFLKIRRMGFEKLVAEKSAELEIIDGRK